MSRLEDLIREIHRRSLWQVLLIYVGGALVAYQAVQALTEGLGLPQWFPAFAILLFIVGLPIVLATAFVRDVAPPAEGPGETALQAEAYAATAEAEAVAVHLESRRRLRLLTWRNAAATFVIVLAAWGVVATGWLLLGKTGSVSLAERPSIAVLPLENRSGVEDDQYFTDGIHDEVLTQLSKISGLSVRARTSVMEYRDSPKNIRQIGEELNARYLVEGGVQRAGANVRINIQLVDSETDEHVFADTYDRELSLENLLAVQREVALRIADALEATLTAEEREQIERAPTENPEAYDYYLRGIEYLRRPGVRQENYRNAQRMLERAVELDPRFALAYAQLSYLHEDAYEYLLDRSEERLKQAREAAGRALEIEPDLPEGHLALGNYYHAVRDLDSALEELAIAERGLPGSVSLLSVRALILKRQGKWDEALTSQERALALSPRSTSLLRGLAQTYFSLRRYEEAEKCFDRVLALWPDAIEAALVRALVPLAGRGDTGPLRTLVEGVPPGFDPWGVVTFLRWYVEILDRDYAAALEVLSYSELEYFEFPGPGGSGQGVSVPKTLIMGMCYAAMGETDRARAAADLARRDLEARLLERPDDPKLYVSLSQAHAVLGHKEEAIRAAQRAVAILPVSRDALDGPYYVLPLATVYAWFGEVDAAVEQIDRYLSVPAERSIESILLDPAIDPIRDDPRFQALVEKYE